MIILISLLDLLEEGRIRSASDPSNQEVLNYAGKDEGRRERFESSIFKLMDEETGNEVLDEGITNSEKNDRDPDNYPIYAVLTKSEDVQEATAKLKLAYKNTVLIFMKPELIGRSTFTAGDSTTGVLNLEGGKIWDHFKRLKEGNTEGLSERDLWKKCMEELNERYPHHDFQLNDNLNVSILLHPEHLKGVFLGPEEAIEMNALMDGLRKYRIAKSFDYVESQTYGGVKLKDESKFKIYMNKNAAFDWKEIVEHLKEQSFDNEMLKNLYEKTQKVSIEFFEE